MKKAELYEFLDVCSKQEPVKKEVIKNHDNNLWWPKEIEDYRKREIFMIYMGFVLHFRD